MDLGLQNVEIHGLREEVCRPRRASCMRQPGRQPRWRYHELVKRARSGGRLRELVVGMCTYAAATIRGESPSAPAPSLHLRRAQGLLTRRPRGIGDARGLQAPSRHDGVHVMVCCACLYYRFVYLIWKHSEENRPLGYLQAAQRMYYVLLWYINKV